MTCSSTLYGRALKLAEAHKCDHVMDIVRGAFINFLTHARTRSARRPRE